MPRIKANGLEFEYDEIGPRDGEPVLLVMGFSAQMTMWPDSLREGLADAGYRVIRFDNRDIGLSHKFDDHAPPVAGEVMAAVMSGQDATSMVPYILDDMAADAAALLDALDAGPAHIVGASMGGMIVQLMALNHPGHVRSLVPVMTTSGDPTLPPAKPEAIAALITPPASERREDVVAASVKARRVIGSAEGTRDPDDVIAHKSGLAYDRGYNPAGVARQYGAILAQPRWHDRLSEVSVPTLVLHGAVDPLIPPTSGRDIAARVPGARIVEIENWGHDVPSLVVPTLVETLTGFLATVD